MHDNDKHLRPLLERIVSSIKSITYGSARTQILEQGSDFHIRFAINGMWFRLAEPTIEGEAEAGWTVEPCDPLGNITDRAGRPEEMCVFTHPDMDPHMVAAFAVMTAARWRLPEIIDNPIFLKSNAGNYLH